MFQYLAYARPLRMVWHISSYHGNIYILNHKSSVQYDIGDIYIEAQAHVSVSSLCQAFEDGVTYIKVSEGDSIEMTEEEVALHDLGIAMRQQFILKAGLKHFGKKGEGAVML